MQLISDKQLMNDIRKLPKDHNKGKSVILAKLAGDNITAERKRERNKKISRARAKLKRKNHVPENVFSGKNIILKDYTNNVRKLNEALRK